MSTIDIVQEDCAVGYAMSIVGGKWKIGIVWKLVDGPLRFGELRRQLNSISEGVLITQLKQLERDGIVHRTSYDVIPPRVDYSLTPRGQQLEHSLRALASWGEQMRTL